MTQEQNGMTREQNDYVEPNGAASRPMEDHLVTAARLDRTVELLQISWYRSTRFPPLRPARRQHQVDSTAPSSQGPTALRCVLTWWFAVTLWPIHAITVGQEARHIRVLGQASGTFKTADRPGRARPALTALGMAIGLVWIGAAFTLEVLLIAGSVLAGVFAVLVYVVPLGASFVDAVRKSREDREGQRRTRLLNRRRDELAAHRGPGYVLTSFLAARDQTGAGAALIEALKPEWMSEHAVVVLYAATDDLIGYYEGRGAVRDAPTGRRMIFDYRA